MEKKILKNTIKKLIIKQFKVKKKEIQKNLNADNVARWDSLGHLTLISILEKKFKISFKQDEVVKMLSEKEIYSMIIKKILKENSY
jgi:acyl carrier protein|tara:strand:+ start:183 stop:440 length:258 start_codon:yes stop_codon:yes gene_type:complete